MEFMLLLVLIIFFLIIFIIIFHFQYKQKILKLELFFKKSIYISINNYFL